MYLVPTIANVSEPFSIKDFLGSTELEIDSVTNIAGIAANTMAREGIFVLMPNESCTSIYF